VIFQRKRKKFFGMKKRQNLPVRNLWNGENETSLALVEEHRCQINSQSTATGSKDEDNKALHESFHKRIRSLGFGGRQCRPTGWTGH
jgi:hypothetical protein